jgi:hypothetical protein
MGVSRALDPAGMGGGEYWSVWARRSDGSLVALTYDTWGYANWVEHGTGGATIGPKGVTATGWIATPDAYERAFYVRSEGTALYERKVKNRAPDVVEPWRVILPPGNPVKTLTGHIAATWNWEGGVRRVRLFATTTDNQLWVYTENTDTWTQLAASGYSTSSPLAASQSPTGTYARVFASNTTNTNIQMFRHDGATWGNWPQGQPAGATVCGTAAAAEDQIDGSTYRGYLFCTRTGVANGTLYAAVGETGAADTSWAWVTLALPAGTARNTGYALTATTRADGAGGNRAIDAYLTDTATNPTRLYHTERVSGALGLSPAVDLGADGETYARLGGLASRPTSVGYSSVYFIGEESGSFAQRLYSRKGDPDVVGSDPWNWANHDSATRTTTVTGAGTPHSESSTATMNARGLTAAILRPTPAANARVEWTWSTNDGDGWSGPLDFPEIKASMEYMTDPTVDFDDQGTGYVLVQNQDWSNDCAGGGITERSAFYRTTNDGASWSAPIEIANTTSLDHPWISIDRLAGADRLHFVWSEILSNTRRVRYRNRVVGQALSAPITLWDGGAPSVTVGAGNVVWATTWGRVCRLSDTYDACSGGSLAVPGMAAPSLKVQGTALFMRTGGNWSARGSTVKGNQLYYAYMADETNGDGPDLDVQEETDVYLIVATYNPANQTITLSPAAAVTVTNDDADQFGPAVSISRDAGSTSNYDNVFVTWYDRRAPTPGCPVSPNRCFRAKRNRSFNGGGSFISALTQDIPVDASNSLSDPALLPPHCGVPNLVFHGDYHESRGELLHSRHVVVGAPLGSQPGTATLTAGWVSGGWWYW